MAHKCGITSTPQLRKWQIYDAFVQLEMRLLVFFPTLHTLMRVLLNTQSHPNGKAQNDGKKEDLQRAGTEPANQSTACRCRPHNSTQDKSAKTMIENQAKGHNPLYMTDLTEVISNTITVASSTDPSSCAFWHQACALESPNGTGVWFSKACKSSSLNAL
jgi:hypothetical protein